MRKEGTIVEICALLDSSLFKLGTEPGRHLQLYQYLKVVLMQLLLFIMKVYSWGISTLQKHISLFQTDFYPNLIHNLGNFINNCYL